MAYTPPASNNVDFALETYSVLVNGSVDFDLDPVLGGGWFGIFG